MFSFVVIIISILYVPWASCQIPKIVCRACAGNAGNVLPPPRFSDPDMHHGTCVTHAPWCMPGSLTSDFLWSPRHSRRMRNPQFYVSCKRPMQKCQAHMSWLRHWHSDNSEKTLKDICNIVITQPQQSMRKHDDIIKRETFSASLTLLAANSSVTGEFPPLRPVTRSFDVFFDLRLNKRLSKQSRRRWFETKSRSLWRHYNDYKEPEPCAYILHRTVIISIHIFADLLNFPEVLNLQTHPLGQNGRHFADIFKCLFMNKKFCILIRISQKFVPSGPN